MNRMRRKKRRRKREGNAGKQKIKSNGRCKYRFSWRMKCTNKKRRIKTENQTFLSFLLQ